ncbi:hypothetical protein [Hymenobacter wooponensis]|uniref:Uncharacterized protein n=1 Tax=Hymenobacter wooponensis TaxID=1525360 RepID=A0A4Z0MTU0_9BACT|nr:hypothetical protein [Hymenobacter wooponensis]TGD82860.1 hypothetical protein EU557_03510 [Hymenobacter wooponensis]
MRHELSLTSADGTETITLQVPTSWDDVTLQQYIDYQCSEEPAVCQLAGITQAQLDRLVYTDAGYLINLLAFAAELPDPPLSEGMRDPGAATYGQMVLANQYIEEHPDQPHIFYAPYLYALYRTREVYGRNDQGKEEQMRQAILQQPVGQCLSDVLFIYAGWLTSMSATPQVPKTLPSQTMTSWKPDWKNWGSVLARCLPSMRSAAPSAAPGPTSTP